MIGWHPRAGSYQRSGSAAILIRSYVIGPYRAGAAFLQPSPAPLLCCQGSLQ